MKLNSGLRRRTENKMNAGIYKIENVLNGNCYIGQSADLRKRKHDHFYELERTNHRNSHLQRAYKKYGKKNFKFDILLYCEPFELTRHEQGLVDSLNPKYNICKECVNSSKGIKHTEKTRNNMSLAHIGNKHSEETRRKMSLASKGRKKSEEARRKMSLAQHNRPEEVQRKISLSLTGRKVSEESKLKNSLAHKNISEETRRKMSLASTGRKLTEESKQKISLARAGIKKSEEIKRNMSLAQKARFERERLQRLEEV